VASVGEPYPQPNPATQLIQTHTLLQTTTTLLPLLLSTLTLSSQHLTLAALTLLSHLFSASHAAAAAASSMTLSDDHVKQTLEALIEAKPKVAEGSEHGEKLLAGWVEGVGEGMVALAR
jgi:ribosomal RNA-processing protein 12